jgi:hypothetical protein
MNVRNENKTANQTNNESMASSTTGGDTHIDGAGESLGSATDGGGAPPGGRADLITRQDWWEAK